MVEEFDDLENESFLKELEENTDDMEGVLEKYLERMR